MNVYEERDDWLKAIAINDDLWISAIAEWPSIIAYEYCCLKKLCADNSPYGVLICLKDNFETFLKMETLLAFAWAEHNTDDSFLSSTISLLTIPNLSFGAWMELARIIVDDLKKIGMSLPKEIPLEQLKIEYEKIDIVNWRNLKIGHGAMEMADDEDFRKELLKKLNELKSIFKQFEYNLKRQKLYVGELCLEGPDLARALNVTGEIKCTLSDSGITFSADPYILIRTHKKRGAGVYFFDNQKSRTLTVFQAYADGSRAKESVPHFEMLRRILDNSKIDMMADPDDILLDESENRELDLLQMSHGFVRPEHLIKWLADCLDKHEKGIFLLQMDRGMGKSVFSEKLDRMYDKPLVIADDIDVRTYHFYRTQSAQNEDIRIRIEWQWANQYGKKLSWQRIPRIDDLEKSGMSASEAFCAFLKDVRRYTERNRNKKRIMMVLDGLDEITQDTVWKMIPNPQMLPEGVYLLLTSRNLTESGITGSLKKNISDLVLTERYMVTSSSAENISFLKTYIQNTNLKNNTEGKKEALLDKAGYRVLYLGMICKLIEYGTPIGDIWNTERIIGNYLKMLEDSYGEKESIHIRELLALIATLGAAEPLLLDHIGKLSSEGRLTLGIIGMMRDLAPMLKASRSPDGNSYTITNDDLANELRKQIPETEEIISELIGIGLDQIKAGYPLELPESAPVIMHITELADMLPEGMTSLGNDFCPNMGKFISDASNLQNYRYNIRLINKCWEQLMIFCREFFGEESEDFIISSNEFAVSNIDAGAYSDALGIHQKLLSLSKKYLGEDNENTISVMHNLAWDYRYMGKYEKALEIANNALDNCIRGLGIEHPKTLSCMHLTAVITADLGLYRQAEKMYKEIIDIKKMSEGEDSLETLISIGNFALCQIKRGRYKKAVRVLEPLQKRYIDLFGEDCPETLTCMNNLSLAYLYMKKYEKAEDLLIKTIDIKTRVLGKNHPGTLTSMNILANCYQQQGKTEKAYELFNIVLEKRQKVLGEDHPDTVSVENSLREMHRS